MFKKLQRTIAQEYSGTRAKDYVAKIIQFHRIQASPGFRAAADYCREVLTGFGIAAEVLSFPANEHTQYWGQPMFQEWEATEATLHLIEPADKARKLADFSEVKTSLIQRSIPVNNLEAEVVLLENGEEEREYEGLDLQGKVVLTQGGLDRVRELAVGKHGAVGILFDGMRESLPIRQRIDLPDARQYTSFWWPPGDKKCFGFVLSPREGENLRKLIKSQQQEGKPPVKVRARVVSRLYDGQIEVVSALIPGETDEEVVAIAHLCHPQTSANDNASGSAALLELARTLQTCIAGGKLPRPRCSIRLLWVPEMTGTFAYLATHEDEIARMVAGVNLDMVGQNQDLCGSVFIIERTPAVTSSFVSDLMERLREEWMGETQNLAGFAAYPLFRHTVSGFSGGSDHWILSDPTVGVPTPMLIQWPDKFYHTSEDTLDKVDPRMLAVVGGLAAAYVYFVANAGQREVIALGHEMHARFRARLARSLQEALIEALDARNAEDLARAATCMEKRAAFACERQKEAIHTLLRLAPQAERLVSDLCLKADAAVHDEAERVRAVLLRQAQGLGLKAIPSLPSKDPDEWEQQAARIVPRRVFRGPPPTGQHMHKLTWQEKQELRAWVKPRENLYRGLATIADYWANGKRTVAEIADLVEVETGKRDMELLVRHFQLLARLGLMTIVER